MVWIQLHGCVQHALKDNALKIKNNAYHNKYVFMVTQALYLNVFSWTWEQLICCLWLSESYRLNFLFVYHSLVFYCLVVYSVKLMSNIFCQPINTNHFSFTSKTKQTNKCFLTQTNIWSAAVTKCKTGVINWRKYSRVMIKLVTSDMLVHRVSFLTNRISEQVQTVA